jgi:preprotein translocase SecE subunit
MSSFSQYLKDTRAELRHVAWPTQTQTIVYTTLVAAISFGTALYLGFFDFLFTAGVKQAIDRVPTAPAVSVQQEPVAPVSSDTAPASPAAPVTF